MFEHGRRAGRHWRLVAALCLLLLALPAVGQSPYEGRSTVVILDAPDTAFEIVQRSDVYSDEVQVVAHVMNGPFAGLLLRGVLPGAADLPSTGRLFATVDRSDGAVYVTAILPVEGGRGVRLHAVTHRSALDRHAMEGDWPEVVSALWPANR